MICPLPYADDVETIPIDESADIEAILQDIRQALRDKERATGQRLRDVHVKSHGCAWGEIRVLAGLSPELHQGLFKQAASYRAFARFSNSSPTPLPDAVPDGRGMAIQVEGAVGEFLTLPKTGAPTQDFILANHPVFLSRDVKDYRNLQAARLKAGRHPLRGALQALTHGAWNPLVWRWREVWSAVQLGGQIASHPGAYTYYSMTPIRFGDYIAKYRIRPKDGDRSGFNLGAGLWSLRKDRLRAALETILREQALQLEFQIQLRTHAEKMPVEDVTVEWPESHSPYQTVAHLTLLQQEVALLQEEGERRAFSVWNALSAHRPLGGINRARRLAYALSSAWRERAVSMDNPLWNTLR